MNMEDLSGKDCVGRRRCVNFNSGVVEAVRVMIMCRLGKGRGA